MKKRVDGVVNRLPTLKVSLTASSSWRPSRVVVAEERREPAAGKCHEYIRDKRCCPSRYSWDMVASLTCVILHDREAGRGTALTIRSGRSRY